MLENAGFVELGKSLSTFHMDFSRFIEGAEVAVDLHIGAISWNGIPYGRADDIFSISTPWRWPAAAECRPA